MRNNARIRGATPGVGKSRLLRERVSSARQRDAATVSSTALLSAGGAPRPAPATWPTAARRHVDQLPVPDRNPRRAASAWPELTEQERLIGRLAGQALTNQQIATRIGRSRHTVNYHLRQIFRKLAISSRVELARIAQTPLE